MRKLIFILFLVPGVFYCQTYHSSETEYFNPKETEQIERTIHVNKDTITIISKSINVTDIQKLVIQYSYEGKMDRIGKAKIYECVASTGAFMYDVGIQLKDDVKKIGITAVDLIKKDWKFMIFIINQSN